MKNQKGVSYIDFRNNCLGFMGTDIPKIGNIATIGIFSLHRLFKFVAEYDSFFLRDVCVIPVSGMYSVTKLLGGGFPT